MIYQTTPGMYRVSWNGLQLGDGTGYFVKNLEGWDDDPGVDDGSAANPQSAGGQDGRLLPTARTVTLDLDIVGDTQQETHELRMALLRATPIIDQIGRLLTDKGFGPEFVNARIIRRSIPLPIGFGNIVPVSLQWKAQDPRRYSLSEHKAVLHPYQAPPGLDFDFDLPFDFPANTGGYSNRATLTNQGTYDTPLNIELKGPLQDPAFTLYTPERVRAYRVAFPLQAGDTLVIRPAPSTVVLNGSASRYGSIRGALIEDLFIPPGESTLALNGTGSDQASLTAYWRDAII
ncbi:phage tail domain-containing protein [Psychromicrobium lacuslunae]|uniref:Tail protein n=1 Tax=Psychromicrobium lacuslunae TaxID=1618207 RepID=A0A0D4C1E8_9MICC|nr:phage tail domain-containing protein [Psychromicrobium lacuslunae]AJT42423.1 hypothetical protein UM93_14625 [Psychromicrobium lacuslunae]